MTTAPAADAVADVVETVTESPGKTLAFFAMLGASAYAVTLLIRYFGARLPVPDVSAGWAPDADDQDDDQDDDTADTYEYPDEVTRDAAIGSEF